MIEQLIVILFVVDLVMKVPVIYMLTYLYFRQKKLDRG